MNDRYRRMREDLEMVLRILGKLTDDVRFYAPQGGGISQKEIINRTNTCARRSLAALHEGQRHLREANSFARMLVRPDKSETVIAPIVGRNG